MQEQVWFFTEEINYLKFFQGSINPVLFKQELPKNHIKMREILKNPEAFKGWQNQRTVST